MTDQTPELITPIEKPVVFDRPQLSTALKEVDILIQASKARSDFQVDGAGLTVAVADTGLNAGHVDFAGRVVVQKNFTADNGGDPDNADDGNAHGTNVGGIIAAQKGDHDGVAPGAGIIPLKVLRNDGGGSFQAVDEALQWVIDNGAAHNMSVVCMSLGDSGNYAVLRLPRSAPGCAGWFDQRVRCGRERQSDVSAHLSPVSAAFGRLDYLAVGDQLPQRWQDLCRSARHVWL